MSTMKSVTVTTPHNVEITETKKPSVGKYQALVRTDVAFLCNMTDNKLVEGHFPGVEDYPLSLGHESTGIITEVGEKVTNFKMGQRAIGGLVFDFGEDNLGTGWGGFCEYTLINDHQAMVDDGVANKENGWFECYEIQTVVDDDIPAAEAGMLCTWREVYGGIRDFHIRPEDTVLIYGAGPVGLSFVKFLKLQGVSSVAIVDPNVTKHPVAKKMGADATFTPDDEKLKIISKASTKKFDVIIDAVGHENIINAALPMIKMGGTIGVYGVIAADKINLEKSTGPYNFNLIIHQWPTRHRERAAQEPLCQWIRTGKLSAREFITHEFKLENITDALQAIAEKKVLKALITY